MNTRSFASSAESSGRSGRFALWAVICAIICPALCYGLFQLGGFVWERMPALSASITVWLFDHFGHKFTMARGELVETVSLVLMTMFAALLPAIAVGLFKSSWRARLTTMAAFYPGWIIAMAAPTMVIYEFATRIDPNVQKAMLACNFLFIFTAIVTSVAIAYALWVKLDD